MNHPSVNALASHKLEQLTTAKSFGFSVPETLVTQSPADARAFFEQHDGHVIVKPLSSGYIERDGHNDSLIYTNRVEEHHLDLAHDLAHCPTLLQQLIRKCSDVRITVVAAFVVRFSVNAVFTSSNDQSERIIRELRSDPRLIELLRGPKGDKGETGDTGVVGPQGLQGPSGAKGEHGRDAVLDEEKLIERVLNDPRLVKKIEQTVRKQTDEPPP